MYVWISVEYGDNLAWIFQEEPEVTSPEVTWRHEKRYDVIYDVTFNVRAPIFPALFGVFRNSRGMIVSVWNLSSDLDVKVKPLYYE